MRSLTPYDLHYVKVLALSIWEDIGRAADLGDLQGYGYVGLLEAAKRFEPGRHLRFSTYAYYRIRGAIFDGLRKMHWAGQRGGFGERDLDFAWPEESVEPTQEQAVLAMEALRVLAGLSPGERECFLGCEVEGKTLQEVGRRAGLSKSWASRLRKRALEKIWEVRDAA